MATWTVAGFDKYFKKLAAMQISTEPIMKAAIYDGVKLAADEVRKSIQALPEQKGWKPEGSTTAAVRPEEKAALLQGLGVTPINVVDDDFLNAKIGFSGYYTDKYYYRYQSGTGKGVPITLIARALESGTSFSPKIPFMRKTTIKVKKAVVEAMDKKLNKEFEKIMK